MQGESRSPFGHVLRAYRRKRGLSQSALVDVMIERNAQSSDSSSTGVISEKTIANLESIRRNGKEFIRPRPATVHLLAMALDIPGGSPEEERFFAAAEATKVSTPAPAQARSSSLSFIREGREDLLQQLEHASAGALAGAPGIVLLSGDAGAGKTHMVHELCRSAREHCSHLIIAWGECTSGAASVEPFLPFVQAMNHLLGLTTQSSDSTIRAHQHEFLRQLLTVAPDLVGSFVDEAALASHVIVLAEAHPDLPDKLRNATNIRRRKDASGRFDQMVRFLSAASVIAPIILVLEDLHWADAQTCALLLHLQRQLKDATDVPLLIIGSYRLSDITQHDASSRHPLESVINEVGRQVDNAVLDLSSTIGTQRGRAFVAGLLRQLPIATTDELISFLFKRTDGHPLFSVELLRWLRETDRLKEGPDGTWTLTSAAINGYAPGRIHSVIRERIARLPKTLRRILEVASVQGNVFMVDILTETGVLPVDSLAEDIDDELVKRHRLLSPREPTTINGQRLHVYTFKHTLFQEYVYDSLSMRDREHLHAATAHASIRVIGDGAHAVSGEIAVHFSHAHQYGDAATHAHNAGGVALNQMDYHLAQSWFERAQDFAEQAEEPEKIIRARNGLVAALRGQGNLDLGLERAREVLSNARLDGSRSSQAESENLLGQILYDKGHLASAAEHLERAVELYRGLSSFTEMSGVEAMLSHTRYGLGAYDQALLHARNAYQTAWELRNDAYAAEALLGIGNCEVDLGQYDAARETYRKAKAIYARAGELRGDLITSINIALCHIQLGQWEDALNILEHAQEIAVKIGTPRLEAAAAFYLGLAYEGKGDVVHAERAFTTSLQLREHIGQEGAAIDSLTGLLRVALVKQNKKDVRSRLKRILSWVNRHKAEGLEDPFAVFISVAHAHTFLGNPGESAAAIRTGHQLLMSRAARIPDPDARHLYIHVVPSNRTLIEWRESLNQHPQRDAEPG